jgi:dTDP-4-dehydrorhamnose reductase
MKILLLGNTGQLGSEMAELLPSLGSLTALDYPQIDLADAESVRTAVDAVLPNLIVNATAYTAVDQAERDPELAEAINARGVAVLAEEAKKKDAFLIHYSTDYVFDGKQGRPYTEKDAVNPLSVYGRSKLHGEEAVIHAGGQYLIFRTSWVYSLRNESGFVKKVLHWSRQHERLRIVDDQISNPTWAKMLAKTTLILLAKGTDYLRERTGLYHLAAANFCSRFEWANEILSLDPEKETQKAREILPAKSSEFPTPAQRPAFSALNCDLFQKTFEMQLPAWQESLRLAMTNPKKA